MRAGAAACKLSTCACAIAVTCGPRVARNEYNYLCIAHAEDTIVLWRTGVVHVLGPACNGGGGGGGGGGVSDWGAVLR